MQPQQPGMYGYPQPPKRRRKTSPAVVIAAVVGAVVLLCCGGVTVVAIVGGDQQPDAGPIVAATSSEATARVGADNGVPPEPGKAAWDAFIADLTAIDPDIVHGKEEKAVDRGRNQCSSVKEWPNDQPKLVDLTNKRFTSPDHPKGFGRAKATKILAAVRKHICPTY